MRRLDKQLTNDDAINIINRSEFGVLSLCDNTIPYGVPIGFVLYKDALYFHCAKEGRKLDIVKENDNVCVTFVSDVKQITEAFTTKYQSAIIQGKISFLEDEIEKYEVALAICQRYAPDNDQAKAYTDKMIPVTQFMKIAICEMSAKGIK